MTIVIELKCQFLQDVSKIEENQVKQELERRSTMENRNWSDCSSRSTTTTPLHVIYYDYHKSSDSTMGENVRYQLI